MVAFLKKTNPQFPIVCNIIQITYMLPVSIGEHTVSVAFKVDLHKIYCFKLELQILHCSMRLTVYGPRVLNTRKHTI